MTDVVEQVRILKAACHRLLRNPHDEESRAALLEALVAFKAAPLDNYPAAVRNLVKTCRDQADALSLRILEVNGGTGGAVDRETRNVCETLTSLEAALSRTA